MENKKPSAYKWLYTHIGGTPVMFFAAIFCFAVMVIAAVFIFNYFISGDETDKIYDNLKNLNAGSDVVVREQDEFIDYAYLFRGGNVSFKSDILSSGSRDSSEVNVNIQSNPFMQSDYSSDEPLPIIYQQGRAETAAQSGNPPHLASKPSGTSTNSNNSSGSNSSGTASASANNENNGEYIRNFGEIVKLNKDFIGWIKLPNTKYIDYAVMKGATNDTYLRADFYKKYSRHGSIFIDSKCNAKTLDRNTIIYGHNMLDGKMFGGLSYAYSKPELALNYLLIEFSTLTKAMQWRVFASYTTEKEDPYLVTGISSDWLFLAYCQRAIDRSTIKYDVDIKYSDKIITLSTCSNDGKKRIVVHARLVRDGENAKSGKSPSANPNPVIHSYDYYKDLKYLKNVEIPSHALNPTPKPTPAPTPVPTELPTEIPAVAIDIPAEISTETPFDIPVIAEEPYTEPAYTVDPNSFTSEPESFEVYSAPVDETIIESPDDIYSENYSTDFFVD